MDKNIFDRCDFWNVWHMNTHNFDSLSEIEQNKTIAFQ